MASLLLTPAAADFGSQIVLTSSAPVTFTVKNTGVKSEDIDAINITGSSSFTVVPSTTCVGKTLVAGATCSFSVIFTPTVGGAVSGTLVVAGSLTNSNSSSLSGVGVSVTPPITSLGLSPASLTFVSQLIGTRSSPKLVTITNTGNTTVTIGTISSAQPFLIQSNNCTGTSLPAGASCTVAVTFAPTAVGPISGTLLILSSAGTLTVPLQGIGAVPIRMLPLGCFSSFGLF